MSAENEEFNDDVFSESGVTIVILSLMVMFSILFEKAREEIEERTPTTLKPSGLQQMLVATDNSFPPYILHLMPIEKHTALTRHSVQNRKKYSYLSAYSLRPKLSCFMKQICQVIMITYAC